MGVSTGSAMCPVAYGEGGATFELRLPMRGFEPTS